MPTKENKAVVPEFYQAFDDRNIQKALESLAPNFVAHMAGLPKPLDADVFLDFGARAQLRTNKSLQTNLYDCNFWGLSATTNKPL